MTALDNLTRRDLLAFCVGVNLCAAVLLLAGRPGAWWLWWVIGVAINGIAVAMNYRGWAKLARDREITIRVEEGQWKWPSNLRIPDRRRP